MSLENFSNKNNNRVENIEKDFDKKEALIIKLPEKYFSTKPIKEAFENRDFTESLRSLEKLNRSIINMVEGVFSHKIMNNRNKKAA